MHIYKSRVSYTCKLRKRCTKRKHTPSKYNSIILLDTLKTICYTTNIITSYPLYYENENPKNFLHHLFKRVSSSSLALLIHETHRSKKGSPPTWKWRDTKQPRRILLIWNSCKLLITQRNTPQVLRLREQQAPTIPTHFIFSLDHVTASLMKNYIKITWETYTNRRTLAQLGAKFDYTEKAYIAADSEQLQEFLRTTQDLEQSPYTPTIAIDSEQFLVNQQAAKAKARADRYQARAERLEQASNEAYEASNEWREFLVLAEPIKIGHHSEKRHRALIERNWKRMDKCIQLSKEAEEAKRNAEYWSNRKFETTETKEQKKEQQKKIKDRTLELWKEAYKVWDTYTWWSITCTIAKINKTTITSTTWSKWDILYSKDADDFLSKALAELKEEQAI